MRPPRLTNRGLTAEQAIARAVAARRTGRWPEWNWLDLDGPLPGGPGGAPARGWAGRVRRVAENGVFSVLVRTLDTAWGEVTHAAVSTCDGTMPVWSELQRIKDRLFGRERIAVDVHPRHSQLIDGADMAHIWVLPPGMELPFGLHDGAPGTDG